MLTCVKCEVRDAATIQERTGQDRPGRNTLVHNTYSCSVHKPHKHKHKSHKHKHSVLKSQQHACAHFATLCIVLWHVALYNVLTELRKCIAELMCALCVPGGGA